ncbi:hypothetical protein EF405_15680 [Cyclobacteriaceae bacterium YHN15]|nr:hypothetical protein EF405_15680 [Cyclobacteriaceae bacterium YHN15]
MKEQFDKRLVEKVKDSFDNHEESFDPKAWENFSEAYFKPKKEATKFTWVFWAASIAVVLGLTILILPKDNNVSNNELATKKPDLKLEASDIRDTIMEDSDIASLDINSKNIQLAETIQSEGNWEPVKKEENSQKAILQPEVATIDLLEDKIHVELSTGNPAVIHPFISQENEKETSKPFISESRAAEEKQATDMVQLWLKDGIEEEFQKNAIVKDPKSPIKLGVLISPQTISNSNQPLNLGAGLMSEISFSKRLKLDLGMAYASQNINPVGAFFNNANAAQSEDASRTANMNLSNNLINTNTELKFGQLEIPINLKFMVMDKKTSGLYLVSGVSNMVYVNQRSVNTFNAVNLNTSGFLNSQNLVQTYSETVRPSEDNSGSNVGQMINFGLGYEHSLKNGTFVSFEPFFKTSVGSQTFLGQQFSIGGMNLRMNFQLKNKN